MPYYFRTTSLTVDSITLTVTHSLSRTATRLRVKGVARNVAGATSGLYVPTIGTNIILVRAGLDASLFDIEVEEVHSVQGGPNG